jgi:FkbM family methyltransferase
MKIIDLGWLRVTLVKFISSNRENKILKTLNKFSIYYTKAFSNVSYNSVLNGEIKVFEVIKNNGCKSFIECGANDGLDAVAYSKISPNSTIYALEIVPPTFEVLKANSKNNHKIKTFNFGLGKTEGEIKMFHYPESSYLSSNYDVSRNIKSEEYTCQVKTGDQFCIENNIDFIDFLKIDVEGMDFEVILGFDEMIKNEKIKVIQFEYTYGFIYAGYFLKNIFDFFSSKNYVIGKIYPNKVEFLDYNHELENFYDANYVAVNKNQVKLIKDLQSY